MSKAKRGKRKAVPRQGLTLVQRETIKAAGDDVQQAALRLAGERFARRLTAVGAMVTEMDGWGASEPGELDAMRLGAGACLALGPVIAAWRFEGDVSAALAKAMAARTKAEKAIRAEQRKAARTGRAKTPRSKTAPPMRGEGPSEGHLRQQAVASPTVHSREKPRHARLTGDLPVAVRGMVQRGWLTGQEARALKQFADDFELGCCIGPSGPGPLRERVDGGLGATARGRAGQAAAAWRRYLDGKRRIGARLARAVESVMVQGVALGQVDTPHKETESKRAGASALLMAAGELLESYYTEIGIFES